ncbi:WD40/YVTN/BNR-like repeat-containing protein [Croceiramulus getboli]|nr:oxidoreductase [Flavobacteriaceae bacterium YJPT1-3]
MKYVKLLLKLLMISCQSKSAKRPAVTEMEVQILWTDSVSIRALEVKQLDEERFYLYYGGSGGQAGRLTIDQDQLIKRESFRITPPDSLAVDQLAFRALALGRQQTSSPGGEQDIGEPISLITIGNPAILYRANTEELQFQTVYEEVHPTVFYDALAFWDTQEGIAMGDPTENCLSVLITRNGGKVWEKLPCDRLPAVQPDEAAFAASNSNIALGNDAVWLLSGGGASRVYYSADRGRSWSVYETPLQQGKSTQGGYAMAMFDKQQGMIVGGDYTQPEDNRGNVAVTLNGGRSWALVSEGSGPGYKSDIAFFPDRDGNELIVAGFTGISYSADFGSSWKELSKEGFYTVQLINDSVGFAAGKNRIAKLKFKRKSSLD